MRTSRSSNQRLNTLLAIRFSLEAAEPYSLIMAMRQSQLKISDWCKEIQHKLITTSVLVELTAFFRKQN
jgi:hypothetical protein